MEFKFLFQKGAPQTKVTGNTTMYGLRKGVVTGAITAIVIVSILLMFSGSVFGVVQNPAGNDTSSGSSSGNTTLDDLQTVETSEGEFQLSSLDPSEVTGEPGEIITVTATVTNNGDKKATKDVEFLFTETLAGTEDVTLSPGENKTVSFGMVAPTENGSYTYAVQTQIDYVEGVLTVGDGSSEEDEDTVSVSLSPNTTDLGTGQKVTLNVTTDTYNGVGSFSMDVGVSNVSVIEVVDYTLVGDVFADNSEVSNDGSTVQLEGVFDEARGNEATIAQVTLSAVESGNESVMVSNATLGDQDGNPYEIDGLSGADITVVGGSVPPVVGESPPQDIDDDGLYEDLNGDNEFNVVDVDAMLENYGLFQVGGEFEEYAYAVDFNGDGNINIVDVQKLLQMVPS